MEKITSLASMDVKLLPQGVNTEGVDLKFEAKHPMFRYEVPNVPEEIRSRLKDAEHIVVVGMGGSAYPLKAFTDFFSLSDRVHFLDTVDTARFKKLAALPQALFCIVSKSGETLEIKSLLAEIWASKGKSSLLFVTDKSNGYLRKLASDQKIPSLEIPGDIGGRFTNFSIFHRGVLEKFGISFDGLLAAARVTRDRLQKDPLLLEGLHQQIFSNDRAHLILWGYGDRYAGLTKWAQQAIAESLGKIKKAADGSATRLGVLPTTLEGPQDQHAVLQLLAEGPQNSTLWFFRNRERDVLSKNPVRDLPQGLEDFRKLGLEDAMEILSESTWKTFEERLANPETLQPIADFQIGTGPEEIAKVVAIIEALVEYSGDRLGINAFDQPGVERGKQIARELLSERAKI